MSDAPAKSPLLIVDGLNVWFPIRRGILARTRGYVKAVNNVSFQLMPGETIGLVGESGCGKTTLGRAVVGLERPKNGRIVFDGRETRHRRDRELCRRLQMIFQDPGSSLNPRHTVRDIVSEGLRFHRIVPGEQVEEETVRWLHEVGLGEDALLRYPHEFSGGQRQRISIARAMAVNPDLVVCDEIVSALDVSVQAQILNLLITIRKRYNTAFLFISHDLSVVRHISHRIAVMYLGQIMEFGPASSIIESPRHPYTKALLGAVPVIGPRRYPRIILKGDVPSPLSPPAGCPFHPRCPRALPVCSAEPPPVHQTEDGVTVRCHLDPNQT